MADSVLTQYYERVDGPDSRSALDCVSPSLVFSLVRPDRRIEGTSRAELEQYIEERAPASHRVIRSLSDGDCDVVVGESVSPDGVVQGTFIAVARVDAAGKLDRYLAAFYPDLSF